MHIVTVEGFARHSPDFEGHPGYVYRGEGWLFRFVIASAEKFFHTELPYVIEVLDIDPRQIYRLVLYGQPGSGSYNVCLYISFEQPPREDALGQLQVNPLIGDVDHSGDALDDLLIDLLLVSEEPAKKSLSDAMAADAGPPKSRPTQNNSRRGNFIGYADTETHYGTLTRVLWTDELSPRGADWNKLNFILSEALREDYDPGNITRFEFRAIPETEHGYEVEAEVLVPSSIEFRRIRTTPILGQRTLGCAEQTEDGKWTFHVVPDPVEQLSKEARALRNEFNRLPLERRIRVWQSHISQFFT